MKLRQIKFENIITLLLLVLSIITVVDHYHMHGFYLYLLIEPFIYLMFTLTVRYIVKDIRVNFKKWEM